MKKLSAIEIPPKEARKASEHIRNIHGVTPILPLETLVRDGVIINLLGKFENVQSIYTFKARGAEWFIYHLMSDYIKTGMANGRYIGFDERPVLVTASAGNHAQGVALAAKRYGLEAIIYMPKSTPSVKRERVAELGGDIRLVGSVFDDALKKAKEFRTEKENRIFVPPFENPHIMTGQASVAVEILSQYCPLHPDYMKVAGYKWDTPDVIISGLGGGGLVSGMGSVVKEFNEASGKRIRIIGVQSEAANSMYRSIKAGEYRPSSNPEAKSVAEGIAVKEASPRMIKTVQKYVDQVVLVSEENIRRSIAYIDQHPDLKDKFWLTQEVYNPAIPFRKLPTEDAHVFERRPLNRVEGAGAASYSAVLFGDLYGEINWKEIASGREKIDVICVLTGSNIPPEKHYELTKDIVRPKNV